eukprot:495744_1
MHYTIITAFSTILWIYTYAECDIAGYTVSNPDDEKCKTLDIQCSGSNDRWDIPGCGCGCKPGCVAERSTWMGDPDFCASEKTRIACPDDYEFWEDETCGCGCAPKTPAAHGNNEKEEGIETETDDTYYFGFINFDMNRYAIYEFVLMIFILMAFVLNVTFVGYCCVIRFKDLDYSFVRDINRNKNKGLYTKTATECSDDDTSFENVFDS